MFFRIQRQPAAVSGTPAEIPRKTAADITVYGFRSKKDSQSIKFYAVTVFFYIQVSESVSFQDIQRFPLRICQNTKGNLTSSPIEKTVSPDVSVTLKLAPSHPLILIIPFILPSSDVKASSPFPLSTKVPFVSPFL